MLTAELYGDELDPKLFKQDTDLGGKASTLKQRNQARAQLAGAPLLVAQLSEMEFRKKLLEGDITPLQNLRMGTYTTVAEVIKDFSKIPPLSLLQIFNPEIAKYVTEHLLQHSNDLDFVQDVLKAAGASKELNPILSSVVAGFARRRRQGRFKYGQLNIHFDRLRFADTATEKDHDYKAKDLEKQIEEKAKTNVSMSVCRYFQQRGGCRFGSKNCKFARRCITVDIILIPPPLLIPPPFFSRFWR